MAKRPYPRGKSPFCSPQPGDLLCNAAGHQRLVISGNHSYVQFDDPANEAHEVARTSWSQWCTRTKACLVSRGNPLDMFSKQEPVSVNV